MEEDWRDLLEFPAYAINQEGFVINKDTGQVKVRSTNAQGVRSVNFIENGRQHRRSVALLVAHAFLPVQTSSHFNTPIHLDGDKSNCSALNLAWRPRWFAIRFHQQFYAEGEHTKWHAVPVYCVNTDTKFDRAIDAAMAYGLLVRDIVVSAHNNTAVFPAWYQFDLLDDSVH